MTKPANSKQLVHVTVSKPVIAAIDQVAAQTFTTRSEFIRRAVIKALSDEGCCVVRPTAAA
jgi:metal-responsive CopG/Arc/MetJ family transcriptional regulator